MVRLFLSLIALVLLPFSSAAQADEVKVQVAEGVAIHVVDTGPRDRLAVVLIPGWGMSADIWRKQISHLATTWRVIAIDPRSQGRSTMVARDISPEARAQDLAAVLADRGVSHFVLVGWSQGVQDAAAFAALPEARGIRGVVLVDALPSAGSAGAQADPGLSLNLQLMHLFLTAPAAYAQGMIKAIFAEPLAPQEHHAFVQTVLQTPPAIGTAAMLATEYGRDRRGLIDSLCVPVLVTVTSNSMLAAKAEDYARSLRRGTFKAFDKAGHALFYDRPAEFNEELVAFLGGIETEAAAGNRSMSY